MDPLNDAWQLYESKQTEPCLYSYLDKFLQLYAPVYESIDVQAQSEGPHLTLLPDELLPVLGKHLFLLQDESDLTPLICVRTSCVVRCLSVLCRNFDNIPFIASCDFIGDILMLASRVVSTAGVVSSESTDFLHDAFTFFECLYDPYFVWRSSLTGSQTKGFSYQPALLHLELIPFFYDCFQSVSIRLSQDILIHCIHLFGAALSGAQHNAIKLICPATVEILFKVVTGFEYCFELKSIVVQCLVRIVSVLQHPTADQVEISAVIDDYHKCLVQITSSLRENLSVFILMFDQLKTIIPLLNNNDSPDVSWFDVISGLFTYDELPTVERRLLFCCILRVSSTLLQSSRSFKQHFTFEWLESIVVDLTPLPDEILDSLLLLARENSCDSSSTGIVRHPEAVVIVFRLLPSLSPLQQERLAPLLLSLCCQHLQSRLNCCRADVIDHLTSLLENSSSLTERTVVSLIQTVKHLGRDSTSSQQLKRLLFLLRPRDNEQYRHARHLVRALSAMAKREGYESATHFWDFQEPRHGIIVPSIRRMSGSGFTFHAWLRLDALREPVPTTLHTSVLYRRHLYSFYTSLGMGFEAFFLDDGILVVAVCIKKEYFTLSVMDTPLDDGLWHSVCICHAAARRPFTHSQLTVYFDGRQKATAQLKCPALTEPFTYCRIGSPGVKTNVRGTNDTALSTSERLLSTLPAFFSLPASLRGSSQHDPAIKMIATSMQDKLWGLQQQLRGQVSSVALLNEALTVPQVKALYSAGANSLNILLGDDSGDVADVSSKLVFCYHAKACHNLVCADLSSSSLYDGRVTAPCHCLHDIRDSVRCIGGVYALFPILSLVCSADVGVSPPQPRPSLEDDDWILLSNGHYSDDLLQRNLVASFLLLLRNFIKNHDINQEHLLQENGIGIISELLLQVPDSSIDVNVLMCVQSLIESLGVSVGHDDQSTSQSLLRSIYQHILLNFAIWNKSDFPVRIGHIQYLSTIIKDDRRFFRKKYGVQFLLDVIRQYYVSSSSLNLDDMQTIRGSLFGLIKYFMSRDVNHSEVCALLGFVVSVKNESVLGELTDTLLAILDNPLSSDQIYLHFFEPGCAELLFGVVVNQNLSTTIRHKILKVIMVLIKSDRIYDKHKIRLRLQDVGVPGLTNFLPAKSISVEMVLIMIDFVLLTDKPYTYQGLLSLLHLTREFGVSAKLRIANKVLDVLKERPSASTIIAKQPSWQDSILSLLVKQPVSVDCASLGNVSRGTFSSREPSVVDVPFLTEEFNLTPPLALEAPVYDLATEAGTMSRASSSDDVSLSVSKSDGVSGRNSSVSGADQMSDVRSLHESYKGEPEESSDFEVTSLWNHVATVLATVFWRGVDGSDSSAWMDRGRLFTCINLWALNNELFASHVTLKRLILEHALKNAIADLNSSSGQLIASQSENARELMRWLYDFIVVDPNKDHTKKFSIVLLDGVLCLLDTLMVFEETPAVDTWTEMTHLGLSFLLACAACDNLELCAVATPKLHAIIQARSLSNLDEAGFLLGSIHEIVSHDVAMNEQEHYSFLIPVLKALIEKTGARLGVQKHLANLPSSQSGPSFFEDFQTYSQSQEWTTFIDKQVTPLVEKFKQVTLNTLPDSMNDLWNQCYEATMIGIHTRNREWGECKLKFQSQVLQPFNARRVEEIARYQQAILQVKSQSMLIKRQWQQMCVSLMGSQGPWAEDSKVLHWKLMPNENLSRMRLKLGINLNFNPHSDASQLRDNLEVPRRNSESLPLSLALEAKASGLQEDSLDEEELNLSAVFETVSPDFGSKEKLILKENCELVTLMSVVKGRLEITTTHVYFFDSSPVQEDLDRQDFKWSLSQLREIHLRRYNLRRSALELFLMDQTTYFLNFTTKTRNKVYSRLISVRPPNLFYHSSRSPAELLRSSGLTQKWTQREISNFDYLMQLNTIAGRTYNDLSQYPVFPWVLSDFVANQLDLNDPRVFRDLSKPIGVVNPKKVAEVKAKYDDFEDSTGTFAKFHYGTHYSNSAGVLHYLVRMEPFTSLHVELQSGRFDVADRQFHSIPGTWRMLMESTNDVKELTPEFFYLPEFFLNMNGFDLGILQESRKSVNDVELPPWAADANDFIYKHRQALESEYVSSHLHEWIDLIFGYKQKGEEAIKALNVFFYCSYEGAVDLDSISDPFEREQLEKMINNFGQTPCQLLKEPHPPRLPLEMAKQQLLKDPTRAPSLFLFSDHLKAFYVEVSSKGDPLVYVAIPRSQVRSFIQQSLLDNLLTISRSGVVGVHGWLPYDKFIPFYFTFEKDPTLNNAKMRRKISCSFQPGITADHRLFVVTHDARLLLSGGHWDNSVRVFSLIRGKIIGQVIGHLDVVTCLALDHFGTRFVSGSRDTTLCVWSLIQQGGVSQGISNKPLRILVGHCSPVTCVVVMSELDVVVSGSEDGSINVHSMLSGVLLRTLRLDTRYDSCYVSSVAVSEFGQIIAVFQRKNASSDSPRSEICVFSLNGCRLARESSTQSITMAIPVGSNVVIGNDQGQLSLKEIYRLRPLSCLSLHHGIVHVAVSPRETHLLVSLEDGKLIVVGICPRSSTNAVLDV